MKIVYSLWVYTQSCPVRLHELPEDVLGGFVEIRPGGVLWEVLLQWDLQHQCQPVNLTIRKSTHPWQLPLEDFDLVEEQDDRCPQEKL